MTRRFCLAVGLIVWSACGSGPSSPSDAPLAIGRWAGGGACLVIAASGCDLVAGCGHGAFARPMVRADGTFDATGTYRIEVGPISIEPAPAARFSGKLTATTLTLNVIPTNGSPPATYSMSPAASAPCSVPCV